MYLFVIIFSYLSAVKVRTHLLGLVPAPTHVVQNQLNDFLHTSQAEKKIQGE